MKDFKKCPNCHNKIYLDDYICPYCNHSQIKSFICHGSKTLGLIYLIFGLLFAILDIYIIRSFLKSLIIDLYTTSSIIIYCFFILFFLTTSIIITIKSLKRIRLSRLKTIVSNESSFLIIDIKEKEYKIDYKEIIKIEYYQDSKLLPINKVNQGLVIIYTTNNKYSISCNSIKELKYFYEKIIASL